MTNILPSERIERSIILLRGHKVMLDRDLAEFYGVEAQRLKSRLKETGSISGGLHVSVSERKYDL